MVDKMYFKVSRFTKCDVELNLMLSCCAPRRGAARFGTVRSYIIGRNLGTVRWHSNNNKVAE